MMQISVIHDNLYRLKELVLSKVSLKWHFFGTWWSYQPLGCAVRLLCRLSSTVEKPPMADPSPGTPPPKLAPS